MTPHYLSLVPISQEPAEEFPDKQTDAKFKL